MATYTPDVANVFLSPKGKALPAADLEAYADLAEDMLGISGKEFLPEDETQLERAVALQISLLLIYDPNASWLQSRGLGPLSWSYREGAPIHAIARELVERAIERAKADTTSEAGAYTRMRSVRGRTYIPPGA